MENERQKPKSRPLAFCAMMAALGTMLMLTGGLIPVLTYCSPLLASFCLIPVLDAYGKRNAWMVDHSSLVIAVYNGTPGGTKNTIEYARHRSIRVVQMIPGEDDA